MGALYTVFVLSRRKLQWRRALSNAVASCDDASLLIRDVVQGRDRDGLLSDILRGGVLHAVLTVDGRVKASW